MTPAMIGEMVKLNPAGTTELLRTRAALAALDFPHLDDPHVVGTTYTTPEGREAITALNHAETIINQDGASLAPLTYEEIFGWFAAHPGELQAFHAALNLDVPREELARSVLRRLQIDIRGARLRKP